MSRRARILLALIMFLPVLAAAGWFGRYEWRRSSVQAGYDAVKVGDSREIVIELMGPPRETEPCSRGGNLSKSNPACVGLLYYSFLERWIIYIDSNGRVIDKVNHEGFY